ncbi:MAG: hypothetical protein JXA33_19840 [Anaerolineae bacterium]|nr:hypothetical protein [Anaerolineae bacterium]
MRSGKLGLVILGMLAVGLLLTACAGLAPTRVPPSGWTTSPLVVATPMPVAGQLTITGAQRVELITTEIFTTTPVGTSFVVVTATLQNAGRSPLELGVGELVLLDAADTAFPRSLHAEFVLRTGGSDTLPAAPLPPGAIVTAALVFNVATVQSPVRLAWRYPQGFLVSLPQELD